MKSTSSVITCTYIQRTYVCTVCHNIQTLIVKKNNSLSKSYYLLNFETTALNAYSQAYILMTFIPEMISFIIRIRLSVTNADLNLYNSNMHISSYYYMYRIYMDIVLYHWVLHTYSANVIK